MFLRCFAARCVYSKPNVTLVPMEFKHAFIDTFCTHGCYQKSRSKGERQHPSRYSWCAARFTAVVKNLGASAQEPMWGIVIIRQACVGVVSSVKISSLIAVVSMEQTRTHNHLTTRAIANSYAGSEAQSASTDVINNVARMVDTLTSTKAIESFMSDELGEMA